MSMRVLLIGDTIETDAICKKVAGTARNGTGFAREHVRGVRGNAMRAVVGIMDRNDVPIRFCKAAE